MDWRRGVARAIDVALCFIGGAGLFYPIGGLVSIWYLVASARFRSVGERAMGLQVIALSGDRCSRSSAFWRGLPWVTAFVLMMIPVLGDELMWAALGLLVIVDVALLFAGRWRYGLTDLMSNTHVIRLQT